MKDVVLAVAHIVKVDNRLSLYRFIYTACRDSLVAVLFGSVGSLYVGAASSEIFPLLFIGGGHVGYRALILLGLPRLCVGIPAVGDDKTLLAVFDTA